MKVSIYEGENNYPSIQVEGGEFDSPEVVAKAYLEVRKAVNKIVMQPYIPKEDNGGK